MTVLFSNSTKWKYLSLSLKLKELQLVRTKFHFGYGKIIQMCLPRLSQLYIGNDSLWNSVWPTSWREANIQPLTKVEIPIECSHFRGINIIPVIARIFEKTVYQKLAKQHFESHLPNTQFAYRTGANCTDALLMTLTPWLFDSSVWTFRELLTV